MKAQAVIIIICMLVLFVLSASFIIRDAFYGETNFDILANTIIPCKLGYDIVLSDKMIILRLDDVQAYAWSDISQRMITDARNRNIPLSLGVIPKNLKKNINLYRFLRKYRCAVEFAQHGWNHDTGEDGITAEFLDKTEQDAYARIIKGKEIVEILSREKVITFIPPNNKYSKGTASALQKANIPVVSSEGSERFDYHTATFNYDTNKLVSYKDVILDCEQQFTKDTICVIMLHPQDFTSDSYIDEKKYETYTKLLDVLLQMEVTFVRFKDVYLAGI